MRNVYFIVLVFILTGCVSIQTKTTGFIDPLYKDSGYQVSKIVLRIQGATLEETQTAEQKLAKKLSAHYVNVIKFMDIAPPTRAYTQEEKAKLLRASGAGSVFTIYITKKGTSEVYIPPVYVPGTTTSQVSVIGNTAYIDTRNTPGHMLGGHSIWLPTMTCLSTLVDLRNWKEIWRAESQSVGRWSSSFSDLLVDIGEDTITDMERKKLLPLYSNEPIH